MKNQKKIRPRAEILTVGDELLKGSTLNSNAKFIGKELTDLGFRVTAQISCPDEESCIRERLGEALIRAEVVVMTGGLGPTPDDLTREAVAGFFNEPLIFSKSQYKQIEKFYKRHGKTVPSIVRREAEFPRNARPLVNRHGIALGFSISLKSGVVIVLPGVPREQENMFRELVRPLLKKRFPFLAPKYSLTLKTIGLSEPEVMTRLGKSFFRDPFDFGIYPAPGEASIRLQAEKKPVIERLRKIADKKLYGHIYAREEKKLAEVIGKLLLDSQYTLATAESCTGGALSAELTAVSGASRYFAGAVIAYCNDVKVNELGVAPELIQKYGAVSREAACAMAAGVRQKLKTSHALAVTGVAGPQGGTPAKPVGTVWIGLASPEGVRAKHFLFAGDRGRVQDKSVRKALEILWRDLLKKSRM